MDTCEGNEFVLLKTLVPEPAVEALAECISKQVLIDSSSFFGSNEPPCRALGRSF